MTVLVLKFPNSYRYGDYLFEKGVPQAVGAEGDIRYLKSTGHFDEISTDSAKPARKGILIKPKAAVVEGDVTLPKFGNKKEIVTWVEKNAPGLTVDSKKTQKQMEADLQEQLAKLKEASTEAPTEATKTVEETDSEEGAIGV